MLVLTGCMWCGLSPTTCLLNGRLTREATLRGSLDQVKRDHSTRKVPKLTTVWYSRLFFLMELLMLALIYPCLVLLMSLSSVLKNCLFLLHHSFNYNLETGPCYHFFLYILCVQNSQLGVLLTKEHLIDRKLTNYPRNWKWTHHLLIN